MEAIVGRLRLGLGHSCQRLLYACRREPVLMVAAVAAIISCFFVPISEVYWSYIDFRVLGLLFALMAVVAGLMELQVFTVLGEKLASHAKNSRILAAVLVGLTFFAAMFITNDVALLAFVPFTLGTLALCGLEKQSLYIVVLETVAANIGSTLTPVGNPQNLYLYSQYQMGIGEFFQVTAPIVLCGGLFLFVLLFFIKRQKFRQIAIRQSRITDKKKLVACLVLFTVCLASVFHFLPWWGAVLIVLFYFVCCGRHVLAKVDYGLLATFVCFFLFVGNLQQIPAVAQWLGQIVQGKELGAAICLSQVVSNVPAAVMLSGFTKDSAALLAGSNIGGMGTLVASLASLISFKLYTRTEGAAVGRYLGVFTAVNLAALFLLCGLTLALF